MSSSRIGAQIECGMYAVVTTSGSPRRNRSRSSSTICSDSGSSSIAATCGETGSASSRSTFVSSRSPRALRSSWRLVSDCATNSDTFGSATNVPFPFSRVTRPVRSRSLSAWRTTVLLTS